VSIPQGEGENLWEKSMIMHRQALRRTIASVPRRARLASVLVVLLTGIGLLGTAAFGESAGCRCGVIKCIQCLGLETDECCKCIGGCQKAPLKNCPSCQKLVNEQCVPDFDQNTHSCNQFPQNQVVRLQSPGSRTSLPIDVTIDQSCNKGTCRNGKCNLISDRWGITKIVEAVEGAVDTIVNPPLVVKAAPSAPITDEKPGERQKNPCLQDPLRKQLLQNLSRGITVECIDDRNHHCRAPTWDKGFLACGCTARDQYPNHIFLSNYSLDTCVERVYSPKGTLPSAEKNFEATMFHEILHIMGNLSHTAFEMDVVRACDKACYGFIATMDDPNIMGPLFFDLINPDLCR
jgi:hypothetical protein